MNNEPPSYLIEVYLIKGYYEKSMDRFRNRWS